MQIDALTLDEADTHPPRRPRSTATSSPAPPARRASLRELGAGLIVGDIPPLAFAVGAAAGIPSIGLGNFTWDWIYADYPRVRLAPSLLPAIRGAYAKASMALRLPMSGGFESFSNVKDIPFIARHAGEDARGGLQDAQAPGRQADRAGRRSAATACPGSTPTLLSKFKKYTVVTTAERAAEPRAQGHAAGRRTKGSFISINEEAMYNAGVRYEDLVGAAEAVVTKPGYGIIAECIANDAAILYTSRGHFPEYDVLVEEMPKYVRSAFISHDDLFDGKWETHLDKLLAQPKPKKKPETERRRRRRGDPAQGARQAAQEAAGTAESKDLVGSNRSSVRVVCPSRSDRSSRSSRSERSKTFKTRRRVMVRWRVWLAFAVLVLPIGTLAQSAAPPAASERFVAASIKPADQRLGGRSGPDHYYGVSTLERLLFESFDLPSFLMFGLPEWASNERWEVSAKAEGPRSRDEMRPLLRALLGDRFALRVHHEIRELPVYELVSTRADGQRDPRLKPATGVCDPFSNGTRPFRESPVDRYGLSACLGPVLSMENRTAVRVYNSSMQRFANLLRSQMGRAIVDKTGFPGLFDFVFDFGMGDGDVPALETALRESFGLKLQSARGMVDVLVIDSVERPTPN